MTSTEVRNPATEEVIATVEPADAARTDEAVARAAQAWPAWRDVTPADRALLLRRFAATVDDHLDELAELEVRNAGHTITNARAEAAGVRDVLHYYAGAPERPDGQSIPVSGGMAVTVHEPIGVVGVIAPWNFPMPIASWSFGPALAAGNTVLLKPAELTPLTAIRLAELAVQAGLPPHVLHVVPGRGAVVGQRLIAHPDVGKIVFTGSTSVGRQVMAGCAERIKRVTLELGGKNANIVFADADVAAAAAAAPAGAFDNAGQDCCARSRLLVHRPVLDEFVAELTAAVTRFRVGDPHDEATQMGPLISADQREHVSSYLQDAAVLATGSCPAGDGYWLPPTVLRASGPRDPAFTEEIFGPVLSILPFDDEAEAIGLANDTSYGLSGSIWTRDIGRALRVARAVQAGNLSINSHASVRHNTPFGGFKQSGLGRELGPAAVDAFREVKTIFIAT